MQLWKQYFWIIRVISHVYSYNRQESQKALQARGILESLEEQALIEY